MNKNQLSKRLEEVSKCIPAHSRVADIGSDHAYLPVSLVLQGKIDYAIAGEVVQGPFEVAKNQVRKNGLETKISVRLADGLAAVNEKDAIDTITICGMGGTLIREILDKGWLKQQIQGHERLVLQPNIGEQTVREWLMVHGYTIIEEQILEENKKIYEIIVAERQATRIAYSQKEQRFGPLLLKHSSEIFKKKWYRELKQREAILTKIQHSNEKQEEKIRQLEQEVKEIREGMNDGN